jgi:DNA-binding XRE family transcriptional regulator
MLSIMKTSTPKTQIQVTLKIYLERQRISAYTLGKWVVGVSPQTVYAVANGSRKPSLEALEAIIQAFQEHGFDTQLEDLLTLELPASE